MLRLEDITILAESGWKVKVCRFNKSYNSGFCVSDLNLILIYPLFCVDEMDYNITICHEFLHAVYPDMCDQSVEEHARLMAYNHIEIIDFIKKMFDIPDYHFYVRNKKITRK